MSIYFPPKGNNSSFNTDDYKYQDQKTDIKTVQTMIRDSVSVNATAIASLQNDLYY